MVWDRSCSETSIERRLPITQVRALCTLPVVCFVGTNFAEEVACGVISMLEDSLSLSLSPTHGHSHTELWRLLVNGKGNRKWLG